MFESFDSLRKKPKKEKKADKARRQRIKQQAVVILRDVYPEIDDKVLKEKLKEHKTHVLLCDDQVVAIGAIRKLSDITAHLDFFAVPEEHRDQGFGKLMIDSLESLVTDNYRNTEISIDLMVGNDRSSVSFLEGLGYRQHDLNTVQYRKSTWD